MRNTGQEYDKWSQPGWKIEQRFSNKVLIGNWVEQKLQFTRQCRTANSTNRRDYRPQPDHRPDVFMRRDARRRAEGLPSKLLLAHHNTPPSHYLVSLYDETHGRQASAMLPTLRSWHPDTMSWAPERSDHPTVAPPTYFGLEESRRRRQEEQQPPSLPALSVYMSTYKRHPLSAFCQQRFASAPRALSSHLHPANHNNKDLELKQQPYRLVPDIVPSLLPPLAGV
ncbi:cilia- and flagella-associated protein 107 [Aplochiton taeniatus]